MHTVSIDGVEYMPVPVLERARDYRISQDVLGQIAQRAAVNCWERHDYMPTDLETAWKAHVWVIHAMEAAIAADRAIREAPNAGGQRSDD